VPAQPIIANLISAAIGMLAAIDPYDQSAFPADKIDDIGTDRLLAHELEASETP